MKNTINYFYNLYPSIINRMNNTYYFNINDEKYIFKQYDRLVNEESAIYELNKRIKDNYFTIIKNKDNTSLTSIDGTLYILLKTNETKQKKLELSDILEFSNMNIYYDMILVRGDWTKLLSEKIDYLEYQLAHIGKKFPLLVDTFSYFVGMAENSISYIKNIKLLYKEENSDNYVISHRRINNNVLCIYDPLNIIIDHKSRDVAEYIKLSFWSNNDNVFLELNKYFSNNFYSIYGMGLLFGRILYPQFYFDMYDGIISGEINEKNVLSIIDRIEEYEDYLEKIYWYLRNYYDIPTIEWLKKNN